MARRTWLPSRRWRGTILTRILRTAHKGEDEEGERGRERERDKKREKYPRWERKRDQCSIELILISAARKTKHESADAETKDGRFWS